MTKKVPIHISDDWLKEISELSGLIGQDVRAYGGIPKTFKFSITLALALIKNHEKDIPDLDPAEMSIFFSSIRKAREKRLALEKSAELAAEANKV